MKTECFKKSIVSDYKVLGMAAAIILVSAILAYALMIGTETAFPLVAPYLKPINVFTAIAIFGVILWLGCVATNTREATLSNDKTIEFIIPIVGMIVLLFGFAFLSIFISLYTPSWYLDLEVMGTIYTLAAIITAVCELLTPIARAYALCKEDTP